MPNINYARIGENIQTERKKKRITQAKLAEMTDLSTNYIGCIECGSKQGSFQTYCKIVSALGIRFDAILDNVLPKPEDDSIENQLLDSFHILSSTDRKLVLKIIEEINNAHNSTFTGSFVRS